MFVNYLEFLSVVFIDLPLRSFHGGCKIFLPKAKGIFIGLFLVVFFFGLSVL